MVSSQINGQQFVHIHNLETGEKNSFQQSKKHFVDSISAIKFLGTYLNEEFRSKGFLLASIDSLAYLPNNWTVYLSPGPKFTRAELAFAPEVSVFVRKHQFFRFEEEVNLPRNPQEVGQLIQETLENYWNNGYPFAQSQLTIQQSNNTTSPRLLLDVKPGNLVTIQKIYVKGDSSITKNYLCNLINIQEGEEFNQKRIDAISSRIKQINFLTEIQSPQLLFTDKGVELFIYVKSNNISSANGIVGLQRNPQTLVYNVTGELDLKLINTLKRGEKFQVKWQSLAGGGAQTQSLRSSLHYPFLFKTKFGVNGKFQLFKRDSTFLELNSVLGIDYVLYGGNSFRFFYENITNNKLQSITTSDSLGNSRTNSYGLGFSSQLLDYIPNPSKGYTLDLSASLGNRQSRISDTLQFNKSLTFRANLDINYFLQLLPRHVINFSGKASVFDAPNIFSNELYRFGGLNHQRGFNEETLRASSLISGTAEYRFLLDKNSHLFAFFDQTWYESRTNQVVRDSPFGFGMGMSFGTNIGIFSISYALGKQFDNPILLSDGKIHFGYLAFF